MQLSVFSCDGCGKFYQDTKHRSGVVQPQVPDVAESHIFTVQIDTTCTTGSYYRVLCADCVAVVRAAINQALVRQ